MVKIETLTHAIAEIAPKYCIEAAFLFGSEARGETHAKSDIDIALATTRPITIEENFAISEKLKPITRNEVEIVTFHGSPPLLLKQIAQEGIVIFDADGQAADNARLYALKRYREAKPLLKLRFQDLKRFLALSV